MSALAGACLAAVLVITNSAQGGPLIDSSSPTDFFTSVAARLLRSELCLDLNQIQVYPTNQYTPSVHRLLQVTANLYDSTTNRVFGLATNYPYCPSVFRPIFRRINTGTNAVVVIAGYREVLGAAMAFSQTTSLMVELDNPTAALESIPVYGTAWNDSDQNEPMVTGIPLVIGARTGFPAFNEFAMQTEISVTRLLEFRRSTEGFNAPIVQTNQMYSLVITNAFGLEAWNSPTGAYPRNLQLTAMASLTAILTNEMGTQNVMLSNRVDLGTNLSVQAGTWSGWTLPFSAGASFVLPWGNDNGFYFLTNSTYINQPPSLVPLTHVFESATTDPFYVPLWWLNLKMQVQFAIVDTDANRIVDYVNLSKWERTVDLTSTLALGNDVANPTDYKNPANQWITNRLNNSLDPNAPTSGIINQIQIGLFGLTGDAGWLSYTLDPSSGLDAESAVDGFRYNLLGLSPIYAKDQEKIFYKSNVFYAPFDPYRPIYIHTSWQVNDPFVHYLVNDLEDPSFNETNRVDFESHIPPLDNVGRINSRYQPWGGSLTGLRSAMDYQIAVKDPLISRSDAWAFPTTQSFGVDWMGRVHRGTPWQTIFLKSTNILQSAGSNQGLLDWELWTGNDIARPNWARPDVLVPDALFTAPTNDWRLVALLNDLFNPNDIRQLASPNQLGLESWEGLLDGLTVFTNASPSELDALKMSSNSPQAGIIARAIVANRSAQPGHVFQNVGDLLAIPEVSLLSPWLSLSNATVVTDEALEIIPSQLLPLLRSDSIGAANSGGAPARLRFTGMDGYSYSVQMSSNLVDWAAVSTNSAENGMFEVVVPLPAGLAQFYRSKLIP